MSRLDKLRKLVAAQPNDPFAHYGLGLEQVQRAEYPDAVATFARVLELDPHYVAAYMQKARAELATQQRDTARQTLEAGILAARGAGEGHAADEMQKLLETL